MWEGCAPPWLQFRLLPPCRPIWRSGRLWTARLGPWCRRELWKGSGIPRLRGFTTAFSRFLRLRVVSAQCWPCHLSRFSFGKSCFRMETVQDVRAAIRPRDWGSSIDLRVTYFHVEFRPADRKWFRFVGDGEVVQFWALLFGLFLSPGVFTRVVREWAFLARAQDIRLRGYLVWLRLPGSAARILRKSSGWQGFWTSWSTGGSPSCIFL